ncbi:MAG TPA: hypothetical protein VHD55_01050 [Candidatus Paceibacterota bacterium]|nr:hypothetical protein [Candidatus Paceibacterota bacterium]
MTVMLWAFIALILTLVAVYDILAYPYRQKSGLGVQTLFGVVRR